MESVSSSSKLLKPVEIPPQYTTKFSWLVGTRVLFFRTVMRLTSRKEKVVRVMIIDGSGNLMLYTIEGRPKRQIDLTKDVYSVFDDTNNRIVFHFKKFHDLAIVFHPSKSNATEMNPRRFMAVATNFIPTTVPIIRVEDAFERIENLTEKMAGHTEGKGDPQGEGDLGLRRITSNVSNVKQLKRSESTLSDGDLLGESTRDGFGSGGYSLVGSDTFAANPDETDGPAFDDPLGGLHSPKRPSIDSQPPLPSPGQRHSSLHKRMSIDSADSGFASVSSFKRQQQLASKGSNGSLGPHHAGASPSFGGNSFYNDLSSYKMGSSIISGGGGGVALPPALANFDPSSFGESAFMGGSTNVHPTGMYGDSGGNGEVTVEEFLALCAKERIEEELAAARKKLVAQEERRVAAEEAIKDERRDEQTARNLSALVLAVCRRRRMWLELEAQAGYEERVLMSMTQLRKQSALSQSPARWTRSGDESSPGSPSPGRRAAGPTTSIGEPLERHYDDRVSRLL